MHKINDVEFTTEELVGLLTELVTKAMDTAPTRGDFTETGFLYHFLDDRNLLPLR